jgi:phage FluMu protein Com
VLQCKRCRAVAVEAKTDVTILIVCPRCGTPLGEWATEAERDTELKEFTEKFRKPPNSKESASKGE